MRPDYGIMQLRAAVQETGRHPCKLVNVTPFINNKSIEKDLKLCLLLRKKPLLSFRKPRGHPTTLYSRTRNFAPSSSAIFLQASTSTSGRATTVAVTSGIYLTASLMNSFTAS